jgi:hypothetical protein
MDKRMAANWIAAKSKSEISLDDRDHFIEVIETELSSLHEGNFARYHLRPSDYKNCKKVWR